MMRYHEPQILDDSDDDFDPKTEDINQYCSIIGLDPAKEPELLWIAKEGILAKLEPPWKAINQDDVGLYYFNFETGDSMWEHPNDHYYRQKVKTEREKKKKRKDDSSPKLAPLRTPRSATTDQSVSNSLDFLKSSNDSFKLGAKSKPVLGQFSLETSSSPSDDDDDDDARSENIQLDINDLQPALIVPKSDKLVTDDYSEDPSDSFVMGAAQFIKKEKESVSEMSKSSKSSSKSTRSKSASKSLSKTSSKSAAKQQKQPLPRPVVEQIEAKRDELTRDIEAEMKKVQMELHATREERYTDIMTAHEEEMYRLEKQAQKLNQEQEQLKRGEIEKMRKEFETEMESAIEREKRQHTMTMESALNGLKASHTKEKATIVANEETNLSAELQQLKLAEATKFESKKMQLRQQIEDEEQNSLAKLEASLLAKKHENERVMEQDKRMFDVLREERSKLEKRNKEELIALQEEHNARRQRLLASNHVQIREIEQTHVSKLSELHLTFEAELTKKRQTLEAKRADFDGRIDKWERSHTQNKLAWAERSVKRVEQVERESHQFAQERTSSPIKKARDDALTRHDLDKSNSSSTQDSTTRQTSTPASERLRQYLKGLEKKLESVTSMIDHANPIIASRSHGHNPTASNPTASNGYVSDRWRAYYGTDFKHVPAKKELDERAAADYRYKSRDMVRTASY